MKTFEKFKIYIETKNKRDEERKRKMKRYLNQAIQDIGNIIQNNIIQDNRIEFHT